MLRSLFLLFAVCLFAFTSCKKTGPAKACFNFSKETVNVGDTVYFLNCSENYHKFIWVYNGGFTLDSVQRHTYTVPTSAGTYDVLLYVGDNDFTSADYTSISFEKKSFVAQ